MGRDTLKSIICLLFAAIAFVQAGIVAKGNSEIVLRPSQGIYHPGHLFEARFTPYNKLWCEAVEGDNDILPAKSVTFYRQLAPNVLPGEIVENKGQYVFHNASIRDIGKYICNVTIEDGRFVWGNQFVYMRPVFYSDGHTHLKREASDDPFAIVGETVKGEEQQTVTFKCPVVGFPVPKISWTKDGEDISDDASKYDTRGGVLKVKNVDKQDEGLYRCIATNEFKINGQEELFTSVYDQRLRIPNSLAWIYPLIVIILILVVLFFVIYCCAYIKRRHQDQYNVAKREKDLRNAEAQKLNNEDIEEEE